MTPEEATEHGLAARDITEDGRVVATFPPTHPNQPDLGFLLGLKSLCTALRMIWDQQGGGELHVEGEGVWREIWGLEGDEQQLGELNPDTVFSLSSA